jgi:hypothetical protein
MSIYYYCVIYHIGNNSQNNHYYLFGLLKDFVKAVTFLGSFAAFKIRGVILNIDGGITNSFF